MNEVVANPVVAEVVPPVAPVTPTTVPAPEVVTISKVDYDKVSRDAARARANQSDADKYRAITKGGHFKAPAPIVPPTQEELDAEGKNQDRIAERGLLQIAVDPAYRDVLDADPTLRDMFFKTPLAVLPLLANDAYNAEDAMTLVKEALDAKRVKPVVVAPVVVPPPTPSAGAINANDKVIDEEYEVAKKNPNTETSLAGMIKARIKSGK